MMNKLYTFVILFVLANNILSGQQNDDTRVLNTSLPVGSLPGNVDVSAIGAATYNIPISIPAGIGGMEPSLTISYNSNGGDGTMGVGWAIAGAGSAIDRVPKSLAIDGVRGRVNYDNMDALSLDGQRLIPDASDPSTRWISDKMFWVQGNPNVGGYFTEDDNFWQISDKTGKTMHYGSTPDSRLEKNGVTFRWLLKTVMDQNGNTMTYNYAKDDVDLEIYISSIEYTGNGNIAGINKIEFIYDKRTDIAKQLTNKGLFKSSVLLKALKVEVSGQLVWKYNFNYTQSEVGISALSEISKEDGAGKALNSTRFQWELPKKGITHTVVANPFDAKIMFTGDFNGDGITDLLDDDNNIMFGATSGKFNIVYVPSLYPKAVGDFDSDGITEIVNDDHKIYKINSNNTLQYVKTMPSTNAYVVSDYNQDGVPDFIFDGGDVYSSDNLALIAHTDLPKEVFGGFSGDLDGDGDVEYVNITGDLGRRVDILQKAFAHAEEIYNNTKSIYDKMSIFYKNYSDITVADCNTYSKNIQENVTAIISYATQDDVSQEGNYIPSAYSKKVISDAEGIAASAGFLKYNLANGDYADFQWALGDIVQTYVTDIINIIQVQERYTFTNIDTRVYEIYDFDRNSISYYNAGGGASLVGNHITGLWAPNGGEYVNLQFTNIDWNNFVSDNPNLVTGDFDGDGKEDKILINQGSVQASTISSYAESLTSLSAMGIPWVKGYVGDFNGDGVQELLVEGTNDPDNQYPKTLISFASGNGQMRIVGINNGLNRKTRIQYKSTNSADTYTSTTGKKPGGLLNLVSQVQEQNGDGGFNITTYTYADAVSNTGQGFVGLTKVTAETPLLGIKTETIAQYGVTNQWTCPIAANNGMTDKLLFCDSQTSNLYRGGNKVSTSTSTFGIIGMNNSYLQVPASTTANDLLTGNSSVTSNTYNSKGQITNTNTTYKDGSYKQVTYADYFKDVLPTLITTRQKHFQDANYVETQVKNTYNNNLQLTQTIGNYNVLDKQLTTSYSDFDAFGHPLTQTTSAQGVASLVNSVTYDPTGRFIVTRTNWMGDEVYTYDPVLGTLLTKTDVYGNMTSYAYDSFGVHTSAANPDGTVETSALEWALGAGPTNALYYTYRTKTGAPWAKTWYDVTGRKLKDESIGFHNISLYTLYTYNANGSLQKESFYTGNNFKTNRYTYNSDGRLNNAYFGAKYTIYTYYGLSVISWEDSYNKSTSKTSDCVGNVLSSGDVNGRIDYTYNSFFKPVQISAAKATTKMTYDGVGNQLTLTDADAGITTYTYDGASRLKTQTDNKGRKQETFYDNYGRVDHVNGTDGTTTYQYVQTGNGKGKLSRITAPNGTYTEYNYDKLGRVIDKKDNIDGKTFEQAYQFDADRLISSSAVGVNFQKQFGYDQYGNLTQINLQSESSIKNLWQLSQNDAYTKKYSLGNGVEVEEQFDEYGFPTLAKATKGDNEIQNMGYHFEAATGNLMWRADNRQGYSGLREDFTYDYMDRLTSNTVSLTCCQIQFYQNTINYATDATGNIAYKAGVGKYGYDNTRPHAPARVTEAEEGIAHVAKQQASYTWFNKVETVMEGDYKQVFTYGPDKERLKSVLYKNDAVVRTRYYTGYGQIDIDANGVAVEKLFVTNDKGDIFAEVTPNGATPTIHYLLSDYQGSLLVVTDEDGSVLAEQSFDPWGRRRKASDWRLTNVPAPSPLFARGYTGHEHMDEFGLINMNGRLYDPVLGSFLSPDPYIQSPGLSLSYNRYSYCLNNPLKYTDPSGYSWWSHFKKWVSGTAKKVFNVAVNVVVDAAIITMVPLTIGLTALSTVVGVGQGIFTGNWTILKNEVKLVGGLFTGSSKQILSRFTWELPQTIVGYNVSQFSNMIGDVKDVRYFHGATVVEHYSDMQGSFTIGSYINLAHEDAYHKDVNGNEVLYNDDENPNILHEYGHYLQSQSVGPVYLFNFALPSLINAEVAKDQLKHNAFSVEQDADIRAINYFGDSNWDYNNFYILGDTKNPYTIDYKRYADYYYYVGSNWFEKMYKWSFNTNN